MKLQKPAITLQAPMLTKLPVGSHRDGTTSLMFIVTQTARLWRVRYCLAGKDSLLSLGKYPAITLAKARELYAGGLGLKWLNQLLNCGAVGAVTIRIHI